MKKFKVILVLFAVLAFSAQVFADDLQPSFCGAEKMGLGLKRVWVAAMQEGSMDTDVTVMVGLNSPISGKILNELKDAGLKLNVTLVTIVSGKINIGDVANLVALPEVKSADAGKKMGLK